MNEMIMCAAVRYRIKGSIVFEVVIGVDHSSCYNALSFMDIREDMRDMTVETEGFYTTLGRFVSRSEAYEIAERHNQLKPGYDKLGKHELQSYQVNYMNMEGVL